MKIRSLTTFAAGVLIGAALWLPVFVASSAAGDAHGWSTLVSIGLIAIARLLAGRFERATTAGQRQARPQGTDLESRSQRLNSRPESTDRGRVAHQ